jgi:hypothetical protein
MGRKSKTLHFTTLTAAALWLSAAHAQGTNVPLVIATALRPPSAHTSHLIPVHMKSAQDGLVAPTGLYANALVGGILGSWITSTAGQQIKLFQRVTAGTDWSQLASQDFACVGIAAGEKCRDVVLFAGDEKDLHDRLRASGAKQALVIVLLQQFDGKRYRARATLREMDLEPDVPAVHRMFTTIYNSDAPEAIRGSAAKLHDYWLGGPTPLLQQEGRTSLSQLSEMLNTLFAADRNERGAPEGWKDLKPIDTLVASGRARCHGIACMGTREFADHGDHIWIAADGRSREDGWLLISLDRNSALRNANAQYQSLPIL